MAASTGIERLLELAVDASAGPSRFRSSSQIPAPATAAGPRARRRTSPANRPAPRRATSAFMPLPVTCFFRQRAVVRALERQALDRMTRSRGIHQIAGDHRVEQRRRAARTPSRPQRDRDELQVVSDLGDRRIGQHRAEPREDIARRQVGRVREARVRQRDVRRRARRRR